MACSHSRGLHWLPFHMLCGCCSRLSCESFEVIEKCLINQSLKLTAYQDTSHVTLVIKTVTMQRSFWRHYSPISVRRYTEPCPSQAYSWGTLASLDRTFQKWFMFRTSWQRMLWAINGRAMFCNIHCLGFLQVQQHYSKWQDQHFTLLN